MNADDNMYIDSVFDITACNLAQVIAESNRFLFHISLIHIVTCIIEDKEEIFTETLFKTLLITSMAIIMYHMFFRKLVEPKLEKMKIICGIDDDNAYYNKPVKQELVKQELVEQDLVKKEPIKQNERHEYNRSARPDRSAKSNRSVCERYNRYSTYRKNRT